MCSEFKLENIYSAVYFCGKNVCSNFCLLELIFAERWKNHENWDLQKFCATQYLEIIIMLGTLDIFTGPEMRLCFAGYRVLDSVKFLLDHRLGYSCLKGGSFNFLSLNKSTYKFSKLISIHFLKE